MITFQTHKPTLGARLSDINRQIAQWCRLKSQYFEMDDNNVRHIIPLRYVGHARGIEGSGTVWKVLYEEIEDYDSKKREDSGSRPGREEAVRQESNEAENGG